MAKGARSSGDASGVSGGRIGCFPCGSPSRAWRIRDIVQAFRADDPGHGVEEDQDAVMRHCGSHLPRRWMGGIALAFRDGPCRAAVRPGIARQSAAEPDGARGAQRRVGEIKRCGGVPSSRQEKPTQAAETGGHSLKERKDRGLKGRWRRGCPYNYCPRTFLRVYNI